MSVLGINLKPPSLIPMSKETIRSKIEDSIKNKAIEILIVKDHLILNEGDDLRKEKCSLECRVFLAKSDHKRIELDCNGYEQKARVCLGLARMNLREYLETSVKMTEVTNFPIIPDQDELEELERIIKNPQEKLHTNNHFAPSSIQIELIEEEEETPMSHPSNLQAVELPLTRQFTYEEIKKIKYNSTFLKPEFINARTAAYSEENLSTQLDIDKTTKELAEITREIDLLNAKEPIFKEAIARAKNLAGAYGSATGQVISENMRILIAQMKPKPSKMDRLATWAKGFFLN